MPKLFRWDLEILNGCTRNLVAFFEAVCGSRSNIPCGFILFLIPFPVNGKYKKILMISRHAYHKLEQFTIVLGQGDL